jgi:hypothetical protein
MVYDPGGYRFTDFLRVGTSLNLLMALITPPLIMLFRAFRSNHPCCWGILYPGNGGRNSLMLAIRLQFATFS